mgnify:FL=1
MTSGVAVHVLTGGCVLAGLAVTRVYYALAVRAFESIGTMAGVVINPVLALSTVHTRAGRAVFIVGLTVGATEAQGTGTGDRIDIVRALSTILAGVQQTIVFILLTILANKTGYTETGIVGCSIQASSTIETG